MTEEVELFDVSSGKTYSVSLKPKDAQRVYNDPDLLSEILKVLAKEYDNKTESVSDGDEDSNDSIKETPETPTSEFNTEGSWSQDEGSEDKLKSNAFRWTDDSVLILLALIKENSDLVVSNKKMNREFWEVIARKMSETGFPLNNIQCVSKWRKIMSKYKNALSKKGRLACSDASPYSCPYYQAMDDLCKTKGWALELFESETRTNNDDPGQSLSSKWKVTLESLLRFFDSYKASDDVISGRMTEQKYFELQNYLQLGGWEWAVRTSSKAPKDWYIFSYEKGDLKIPYFGHPFVLKKNILLECVHGDLYYGLTNKRKATTSDLQDASDDLASGELNEDPPRKRRATKPTKKLSCPAFMKVVLVYYFPDYNIDRSEPVNWRSKGRVIQELKRDIELKKSMEIVAKYYVKMSLPKTHNHDILLPKAIVTPMAPTLMKAYVDTRLVKMKETNISERSGQLGSDFAVK